MYVLEYLKFKDYGSLAGKTTLPLLVGTLVEPSFHLSDLRVSESSSQGHLEKNLFMYLHR